MRRYRSLLLVGMMMVFATVTHAQTRVTAENSLWILENGSLRVTIDPYAGTLAVKDKTAGYEWRQAPGNTSKSKSQKFREVRELSGTSKGISFQADFVTYKTPETSTEQLSVTIALPDTGADLLLTTDAPDRQKSFVDAQSLAPLMLDTPDAVLLITDNCNGHAYPVRDKSWLRYSKPTSWIDLPWVGLCDIKTGLGYMVILETSDDGIIDIRDVKVNGHEVAVPQLRWRASHNAFAYPRKLIYHFTSTGGYVALAKRYRAYAAEHGLIVPFTEKVKKNPNLERLFGAPDVWVWGMKGEEPLKLAQEAKKAGVEKMLMHLIEGRPYPADLKTINDLGYLTSEYDNFSDILPITKEKPLDREHDLIPETGYPVYSS